MKRGIGSSILFAAILAIGASPLWAIAASANSGDNANNGRGNKGLAVTVPPETRVPRPQVDMPEHAMTRANKQKIEDARHQPIKDQAGNIQYIVTFADDAPKNYPARPVMDSRFANWHDSKVLQLLHDTEAAHGLSATHLFSQTMQGFAAFLTPQQAEKLGKDKRVKLMNQSMPVDLSGGIWNDTNPTYYETLPWGIQAVGGNKTSNGGATVYVVDLGIEYNNDLNVTSRWAVPGFPLVGAYHHATFVAGIIGAKHNGSGVIGVDSGVNLVSLAYGGNPPANIISTLEEAKARIRASGRMGVVNLSSNPEDNSDLNNSIRSLITPSPSTNYPGAFFVQSAGNQYKDACDYSFNNGNASDGALVVGAMDSNGQPVQPLNGDNGFNLGNQYFGTFEGSNYGGCVDAWAPGKKVKSTWPDGSNPVGDGTSFAAPHIAGAAAYLIETNSSLQTPAAVETAVRSHMGSNGAGDLSGRSLQVFNLDGVGHVARPTVEFKIGINPSSSAPENHSTYSDVPFHLSYDSVGAQSCDLYGYVNGSLWYYIPNFHPSYDWGNPNNVPGVDGNIQLNPDQYRWDVYCRSANGTTNTASASATVVPPAPSASFTVNSEQYGNNGKAQFPYGQSFSLSYASSDTTYCNLRGEIGPPIDPNLFSLWYYMPDNFSPWYEIDNFESSFGWGTVMLEPGSYRWTIDCWHAYFPQEHIVTSLYMNIYQ